MSAEPNHCLPLDLNKVASVCNAARIQFQGKTVEFYVGYMFGVPKAYCAEYGCTLPVQAEGDVLLHRDHDQLPVFWVPAHTIRMSDPTRPQQLLTMIPRLSKTPQIIIDDVRLRENAATRKASPTNPVIDAFLAVRSFMQDADKETRLQPMPFGDLFLAPTLDAAYAKQVLGFCEPNPTVIQGSYPPEH